MNVLFYFENKYRKLMIKICCEKTNTAAYKSYEKIFGKSYHSDSMYSYFSCNIAY
jgi:hypothetical protein